MQKYLPRYKTYLDPQWDQIYIRNDSQLAYLSMCIVIKGYSLLSHSAPLKYQNEW